MKKLIGFSVSFILLAVGFGFFNSKVQAAYPYSCSIAGTPNSFVSFPANSDFLITSNANQIVNFVVDFGDGSSGSVGRRLGGPFRGNILHTYDTNGNFAVTAKGFDSSSGGTQIAECSTGINVNVQQQKPVINFYATPVGSNVQTNQILLGQPVTLRWTSQYANTCMAKAGAGFQVGGTSGSDNVNPLAGDTTFAMSCTGPGGTTESHYRVTVFKDTLAVRAILKYECSDQSGADTHAQPVNMPLKKDGVLFAPNLTAGQSIEINDLGTYSVDFGSAYITDDVTRAQYKPCATYDNADSYLYRSYTGPENSNYRENTKTLSGSFDDLTVKKNFNVDVSFSFLNKLRFDAAIKRKGTSAYTALTSGEASKINFTVIDDNNALNSSGKKFDVHLGNYAVDPGNYIISYISGSRPVGFSFKTIKVHDNKTGQDIVNTAGWQMGQGPTIEKYIEDKTVTLYFDETDSGTMTTKSENGENAFFDYFTDRMTYSGAYVGRDIAGSPQVGRDYFYLNKVRVSNIFGSYYFSSFFVENGTVKVGNYNVEVGRLGMGDSSTFPQIIYKGDQLAGTFIFRPLKSNQPSIISKVKIKKIGSSIYEDAPPNVSVTFEAVLKRYVVGGGLPYNVSVVYGTPYPGNPSEAVFFGSFEGLSVSGLSTGYNFDNIETLYNTPERGIVGCQTPKTCVNTTSSNRDDRTVVFYVSERSFTPTLTVSPPSATINVGSKANFIAWYDSDGPSGNQGNQNVTANANWSSNRNNIASSTVNKGEFMGNSIGAATISASYSGITATASLNVTSPSDDFSCSVNPSVQTTGRSMAVGYNVLVTPIGNFGESVSLSVENLPSGISGQLNPTTVGPNGTSTLTLNVSDNAQNGRSTFAVNCISGGITHTANADIIVNNSINNVFGCSITADPKNGNAPLTTNATVNASNGSVPYVYKYDWESDGTYDTNYLINNQEQHTYYSPGTYRIAAQVEDLFGNKTSCNTSDTGSDVVVNQPPQVSDECGISASPASIVFGQTSILTWGCSIPAGKTCSIDKIGSVDPSGSRPVTPDRTTTYTLSCTGVPDSAATVSTFLSPFQPFIREIIPR